MVDMHILVRWFWQKIRENIKFEEERLRSLKNSSPGSKAGFSEKVLFGVWRLILSV